jgi:hypothetical protein
MSQVMTENKVRDVKAINKQIASQIRWKNRISKYNKDLYEGIPLVELGLSQSEQEIFEKNKFQSRNKFGAEFFMFDRKLASIAERKIRSFQKEKAVLTVTVLRDAIERCDIPVDFEEGCKFALIQAQDFLREGQEGEEKPNS